MPNDVTTIHRKHEHEILQAVSDLEKRGYYLIYGPAEKTAAMTTRGSYDYQRSRYESIGASVASAWICKMRRSENNGIFNA
jgi:hypothetical protein